VADAVRRVVEAGRPVFTSVDEVRAVLANAPLAPNTAPRASI
jgi:hypothetical protein